MDEEFVSAGIGGAATPEQQAQAGAEPTSQARERHAALTVEIEENRYRYHVLDSPTIADGQYGLLVLTGANCRK